MIPVAEALEVLLERAPALPTETVGLAEAAGRVLREPIFADRDLPPFDRSAVDGYAVRAGDLANGGGRLRVVGEIRAGVMPRAPVGPGEAAAVMTGAPIPEGADAAIMVEHTVREGPFVRWPAGAAASSPTPVRAGDRIAPRGAEVRAGTRLLEAGVRLSPAAVGVLATVGKVQVTVGRRPRLTVFSTGDELRHPRTAAPGPAQIRDANSHLLSARARSLGLPVRRLGFVGDDPSRLAEAVARGLEDDVIVVSGGVSMGRHDHVEPVLQAAGVELLITAVAIRPGKPFVFGIRETPRRTAVFGLPGNPVSALTTFEILARPALDRMEGLAAGSRPRLLARLLAPVTGAGPRRAYLPARVEVTREGELNARPVRSRGSADIAAAGLANAFIEVPESAAAIAAGERVRVVPLSGFPDPQPGWHDPRE